MKKIYLLFLLFLLLPVLLFSEGKETAAGAGKYVGSGGLLGYFSSDISDFPSNYGLKDVSFMDGSNIYFTDFFPVFTAGGQNETLACIQSPEKKWTPNPTLERGYQPLGRIFEKATLQRPGKIEVTETVSSFPGCIFIRYELKNTGEKAGLKVTFTGSFQDGVEAQTVQTQPGLVFLNSKGAGVVKLLSDLKFDFSTGKNIFSMTAGFEIDKEAGFSIVILSGRDPAEIGAAPVNSPAALFASSDMYWEKVFSSLDNTVTDPDLELFSQGTLSDLISAYSGGFSSRKSSEDGAMLPRELFSSALLLNEIEEHDLALSVFGKAEKLVKDGVFYAKYSPEGTADESSGVDYAACALYPLFIFNYFRETGAWCGDYALTKSVIRSLLNHVRSREVIKTPDTGINISDEIIFLAGLGSYIKISELHSDGDSEECEPAFLILRKRVMEAFDRSSYAYKDKTAAGFEYNPGIFTALSLVNDKSLEGLSTAVWVRQNRIYGPGLLVKTGGENYGADLPATASFINFLSGFPGEEIGGFIGGIKANANAFYGINSRLPAKGPARNDILTELYFVNALFSAYSGMNPGVKNIRPYGNTRKIGNVLTGVRNIANELLGIKVISEESFSKIDRGMQNAEGALKSLNENLSSTENKAAGEICGLYILLASRLNELSAKIDDIVEPRFSGLLNFELLRAKGAVNDAVSFFSGLSLSPERDKLEIVGNDNVKLHFTVRNGPELALSDIRMGLLSIPGSAIPFYQKKLKESLSRDEALSDTCEFKMPRDITQGYSAIMVIRALAKYKGFELEAQKAVPVSVLPPFTYEVKKEDAGYVIVIKSNIRKIVDDVKINLSQGFSSVTSFPKPLAPGGIIHCVLAPTQAITDSDYSFTVDLTSFGDTYVVPINIPK